MRAARSNLLPAVLPSKKRLKKLVRSNEVNIGISAFCFRCLEARRTTIAPKANLESDKAILAADALKDLITQATQKADSLARHKVIIIWPIRILSISELDQCTILDLDYHPE